MVHITFIFYEHACDIILPIVKKLNLIPIRAIYTHEYYVGVRLFLPTN